MHANRTPLLLRSKHGFHHHHRCCHHCCCQAPVLAVPMLPGPLECPACCIAGPNPSAEPLLCHALGTAANGIHSPAVTTHPTQQQYNVMRKEYKMGYSSRTNGPVRLAPHKHNQPASKPGKAQPQCRTYTQRTPSPCTPAAGLPCSARGLLKKQWLLSGATMVPLLCLHDVLRQAFEPIPAGLTVT